MERDGLGYGHSRRAPAFEYRRIGGAGKPGQVFRSHAVEEHHDSVRLPACGVREKKREESVLVFPEQAGDGPGLQEEILSGEIIMDGVEIIPVP